MAIAVRPQVPVGPLTYDDVQQFPDDGLRYELVDGELLVSPSPGIAHQRCVTRLVGLLLAAVPAELEVIVGLYDWYVRPTTYFEPDLLVVRRDARLGERRTLDPPVLAVEVLSPSTRLRDLGLKRRAYEDAGLPWYWVVDPDDPALAVHELVDGRFVERAAARCDEPYRGDRPFPVEVVPAGLPA